MHEVLHLSLAAKLVCRRVDIEGGAPTAAIANAPQMRQNLMSLAR